MGSMKNSAGISRTGSAGSYAYAPIDNQGDSTRRPIAYVSWFDAARFANWMANGRPVCSQGPVTTENGTYPLNGATRGVAVARNSTQSNSGPGSHIGSKPNQVNYIDDYSRANTYSVTQEVAIHVTQNYLTDAGYFRSSPSYYGAFDLNGIVHNWKDLDGTTNAVRGLRGRFWFSGPPSIQTYSFNEASTEREANDSGIRLAGPGGP